MERKSKVPGSFYSSLIESSYNLIFFGGKGGVGKTTSSAAVAFSMALPPYNQKTLILSTDPAHSLGDCFGMEIGDDLRQIEDFPNLYARELDAPGLMKKFIAENKAYLKALALRGTYFDSEDVEGFFNLSLPGSDEVAALLELSSLLEGGGYDRIIVDTAPAGHTLAMLKLPGLLRHWIDFFEHMQSKHHILQEHFARRRIPDDVDAFLAGLNGRLSHLHMCLKNKEKTEFVIVATPGAMCLQETKRVSTELGKMGISSRHVIVNRAWSDKESKRDAGKLLETITGVFPHVEYIEIPNFCVPTRGIEFLKLYASALSGGVKETQLSTGKETIVVSPHRIKLREIMGSKGRLLIVAGKGGVGKTTVAAATALCLAKNDEKTNYLILSIDPAHSLSDIFCRNIGNRKTRIRDNLFAREMDSSVVLDVFKDRYREDIDSLFDQFTSRRSSGLSVDLRYDRELLHSLIDLSPPGLDELMAIHEIVSIWDDSSEHVDYIILDTAPTGHLIRFIEMPVLIQEWLHAIFKLLLKYKGVIQLGDVAEKLVVLSRHMRKTVDILTNSTLTRAIAVAVPEAMIVAETERLVDALSKRKIAVPYIVANMISDHNINGHDEKAGNSHFEALRSLHEIQSSSIVEVPVFKKELTGIKRIEKFGDAIYRQ